MIDTHSSGCDSSLGRPPTLADLALRPVQQRAVEAPREPQLVLAGPGTGKTRVLVHRAAHLILDPVDPVPPSRICLFTYTNRAASQLRRRLTSLVGHHAGHVRAGTIHQFAYTLIRQYADRLGIPADFMIADELLTAPFFQSKAGELPSKPKWKELELSVSRHKLGLSTNNYLVSQTIDDYEVYLKRYHALDFDDILLYARELVSRHPDVRQEICAGIDALLIDEFQDTDPVQYDLLTMCVEGKAPNIFCVADDDQSIFSFRGAEPANVRRFMEEYDCRTDNGRRHVLNFNYRSTRPIFSAAETVLTGNSDRLKRAGDIEVVNEEEAPVSVRLAPSTVAEHDAILNLVHEWIDGGCDRAEIAVLAPTNRLLLALEERLLSAGIACETTGSTKLIDVPVMRKLRAVLNYIAYLDHAQDGHDEYADALYLTYMREVVDRQIIDRLGRTDAERAAVIRSFQMRQRRTSIRLHAAELHALMQADSILLGLMREARRPGRLFGDFVDRALRTLDMPDGLLRTMHSSLSHPFETSGVQEAVEMIRALDDGAEIKIALSLTDQRLEQRAIEMLRLAFRAMGRASINVGDASSMGESRHEPVDLFVTDKSTGGGVSSANVIMLGGSRQHSLFGDAHVVTIDPEGRYSLSSTQLFKLVQGLVATPPEPLFKEYVMVDVETTSTDPETCRVVEIAGIKVRDGAVVGRFSEICALPHDLTPDEWRVVSTISGFAEEDFNGARSVEDVWADFASFSTGLPLVAHNGHAFDFVVLERLNVAFQHRVDVSWPSFHDMLPDVRKLFPDRRSYKMQDLKRDLLDDATPTEHRALGDCNDQQRVLEHMQKVRAVVQAKTAFEWLLPLLTIDAVLGDVHLVDDEELLLVKTGYVQFVRGRNDFVDWLQRRGDYRLLTARIQNDPVRAALVQDLPASFLEPEMQLDLSTRIDALFRPFQAREVADNVIPEVLSALSLWDESQARTSDTVLLSTYHSAKGLEFERVICSGVHDSHFPFFSDRTKEEIAESRRLLYVGMTRAKRHLVITVPQSEKHYGKIYRKLPSRFLRHLPAEHVVGDAFRHLCPEV